jgi:UPF0716 family protein affecting phage T7 exclusion
MFFSRIALALFLAEVFGLFVVVGEIGFFATLGLWALSAVIGVWLIRRQGMTTFGRAQAAFSRGEIPVGEMYEGLCIFGAGLLLIMPGFVSDLLAVALFIPSFRNFLRIRTAPAAGFKAQATHTYDGDVIDGVYERVPERMDQIPPKTPEK